MSLVVGFGYNHKKGAGRMLARPSQNEFPEYYIPYINLVPEGDLLETLKHNLSEVETLFAGISEEKAQFRYAENKWSMKEVLGHMTDTERIMSYRLLRIGRGDNTPLAGFNETDFVAGSKVSRLPVQTILNDFIATRKATLTLIENMPEEAWTNRGNANNFPITAQAVAYIIAGHEIHHRNIITDRYL
jgi:hypothetical protein